VGTAIVKFGAGCAGRADGADDLVAKLDHHSTTEKHDVRQLGKWRNRILALGALGQGKCNRDVDRQAQTARRAAAYAMRRLSDVGSLPATLVRRTPAELLRRTRC